jgi:hypothetical protein
MAQTVKKVAKMTYNVAVDGGVVGAITPAITETLPKDALVTNVYTRMTTALDSGTDTGTIAVYCGAIALTAADAEADVVDYAKPLASSATAIEITTGGTLNVVVAGEEIDTGLVDIYVEYLY